MRTPPYNPHDPYLRGCIRCDGKFTLPNNPMAHAFSICPDCRKVKEETLQDQNLDNLRRYL